MCMCVIKWIGKRNLYLFALVGCAISCFSIGKNIVSHNAISQSISIFISYPLGVYAFLEFPFGHTSFDNHYDPPITTSAVNYLPLCMLCSLAFFTNLGVYPITFILLSEVFPFK